MNRRAAVCGAVLVAALAAAVVLRIVVGSGGLAWPDGAVLDIRLTRVATGVVVGAALAVGGVLLQCLLRNPLASPDLVGLASGSGLGVMMAAYIAFRAGAQSVGIGPSAGAALAGSLGALALVYALSQRRGLLDPVSLILVGVVVSIMCSAVNMFFQQLLPDRGLSVSRWMLGALSDDAGWKQISAAAAVVGAAIGLGVALGPAMDAASLSEDEARSVGVPLAGLRVTLFVTSGALAAAAVMLAGPIGFVGLICPHVVRLGAGPAHRPLVILAAIAGAALIVGADALVKAIDLGSGRLPIGVLTSVLGGPLLVVMLRRELRGG
jgi:iron complex transport system permease protein